ncbi:ATP-binding protein [Streptomyces sp. NRRL F-2664]|uniref:ATP-binding protein n=1 Tax=Streptomyces sp. NRRL F-2664 TaxID=1463842 RepID=UPI00068DBD63|nr:ATP-binding protein [Streptomyces sp. NRRL F-2664]
MGPPPSAAHHREIDLRTTAGTAACSAGLAWVRRTLSDWGLVGRGQDAVLVAAELLANAVEHADGIHRLTLAHHDRLLQIAVTDPSAAPPRLREHRPGSIGGHGLFLVDRLARQWGWRPNGRGKTVWADLDLGP